MEKKQIIEKLEGIIEVTKGCISVTGNDEWNGPWIEEIEALNYAIKDVKENEKLQVNVTKVLNSLVQETEKKITLLNEKQELLEALCNLVIMTRREIYSASSYADFDKAIEVVRKYITNPVTKEDLNI